MTSAKKEAGVLGASWHDGRFVSFRTYSSGAGLAFELEVDLYIPDTAKVRSRVRLSGHAVKDLAMSVDAAELKDNEKAGNISSARIRKVGGGFSLSISLCAGHLHLRAASVKFLLPRDSSISA